MKQVAAESLPSELVAALGIRRRRVLQRAVKRTGLPAEALLDLAMQLLDVTTIAFSSTPIHRTAVALGAARWRNVSAAERSELARLAVQARWAKHRANSTRNVASGESTRKYGTNGSRKISHGDGDDQRQPFSAAAMSIISNRYGGPAV